MPGGTLPGMGSVEMEYAEKSSGPKRGPLFPTVGAGGQSVSVSAGKGGTRVGITGCSASRAASNVRSSDSAEIGDRY